MRKMLKKKKYKYKLKKKKNSLIPQMVSQILVLSENGGPLIDMAVSTICINAFCFCTAAAAAAIVGLLPPLPPPTAPLPTPPAEFCRRRWLV